MLNLKGSNVSYSRTGCRKAKTLLQMPLQILTISIGYTGYEKENESWPGNVPDGHDCPGPVTSPASKFSAHDWSFPLRSRILNCYAELEKKLI